MQRRGRPPAATSSQVQQVRALALEGVSKRRIAEIVFGHARFHGRVERIGRGKVPVGGRDVANERSSVLADQDELPTLHPLLNRHRRRLADTDLPSLKEIALLLKLEQHLETDEALKRLNALTREVD